MNLNLTKTKIMFKKDYFVFCRKLCIINHIWYFKNCNLKNKIYLLIINFLSKVCILVYYGGLQGKVGQLLRLLRLESYAIKLLKHPNS